ncbi:hypothetical protein HY745_08415 [Candidatus Desantisbacteria bacterium]|nr:hypothetical protein [Candidatus Desantisbacteria bacterium]
MPFDTYGTKDNDGNIIGDYFFAFIENMRRVYEGTKQTTGIKKAILNIAELQTSIFPVVLIFRHGTGDDKWVQFPREKEVDLIAQSIIFSDQVNLELQIEELERVSGICYQAMTDNYKINGFCNMSETWGIEKVDVTEYFENKNNKYMVGCRFFTKAQHTIYVQDNGDDIVQPNIGE